MAKLNIMNVETAKTAIRALREQGYAIEVGKSYPTKGGKVQCNIWILSKDGEAIHHKDKFLVEMGACYCPKKNATTKGGREKQHRKEWFIKVVDVAS